MMRLGIFAKTFSRPTLAETLDAVVSHGFNCIQFNFACAGLPSMPEEISQEAARRMGSEIERRKLAVVAVSGTFNMIHPDAKKKEDGMRRLAVMAAVCPLLKTPVITLCTGTRDVENMWRHHPQNDSPEAWRDLLEALTKALDITERHMLTLGIEPETANVISSAQKARRLLDEMKSPRLKIVFDAANLFQAGELSRQREILDEAFDLLGSDIVAAHAKDVREENGGMAHVAAGKGSLDYDYYLLKLREAKFSGPLILHGLEEKEVDGCAAWLRDKLANGGRILAGPISAEAGKNTGETR
jgi:sugar phosphate isomerase/epimerase